VKPARSIFNDGWNKSHGTVEKTPRIDSYEAGAVEGWGCLFAYREKGLPLVLDCIRYMEYGPEADREIVEVWHPKDGWSRRLELSRKRNATAAVRRFSCVRPVESGGGICIRWAQPSFAANAPGWTIGANRKPARTVCIIMTRAWPWWTSTRTHGPGCARMGSAREPGAINPRLFAAYAACE